MGDGGVKKRPFALLRMTKGECGDPFGSGSRTRAARGMPNKQRFGSMRRGVGQRLARDERDVFRRSECRLI
jgi:hypothetical protein